MLNDGDCIEFLADVRAPVAQAGRKGERRIVGQTIGNYPANYLLRGGYIRKVEAEPVAEPDIKDGPESSKKKHQRTTKQTEVIDPEERRQEDGEDDGRTDQEGNHREQDKPDAEAD